MSKKDATHAFLHFQRTGDTQSLAEVFDLTAAELVRVAHHLTHDSHRAEDLVQGTFLIAIERRGKFQPTGKVLSWLLGIMTNLAGRERYAASRTRTDDLSPLTVEGAANKTAQKNELDEIVSDAIANLSESYRPVLKLYLGQGMTRFEIAQALDRAPGTVRKQLQRGLELLRQALPASIIAGSVVLTTPVKGLATMREVVLSKATAVVAKASFSLTIGKLTLWTAAGTLTAAALAVSLMAPDMGQVTFDELSPKATASVAVGVKVVVA